MSSLVVQKWVYFIYKVTFTNQHCIYLKCTYLIFWVFDAALILWGDGCSFKTSDLQIEGESRCKSTPSRLLPMWPGFDDSESYDGLPEKKPLVSKLLDSPSKLPCICLWNKRRIWPYIKSHKGPYSKHPFICGLSLLLSLFRKVFLRVLWFSLLLKNQRFHQLWAAMCCHGWQKNYVPKCIMHMQGPFLLIKSYKSFYDDLVAIIIVSFLNSILLTRYDLKKPSFNLYRWTFLYIWTTCMARSQSIRPQNARLKACISLCFILRTSH